MEKKEINLVLTIEQINVILTSLGELPAKISYELINEIRKQANATLQSVTEQTN